MFIMNEPLLIKGHSPSGDEIDLNIVINSDNIIVN